MPRFRAVTSTSFCGCGPNGGQSVSTVNVKEPSLHSFLAELKLEEDWENAEFRTFYEKDDVTVIVCGEEDEITVVLFQLNDSTG